MSLAAASLLLYGSGEMVAISPLTLEYQSGADQQKRWLGVTSLLLWIVTLLGAGGCFIAATQAKGWDGLSWLIGAFMVSWIGCGMGALFALFGAFPRRRRHRFAILGLILNLLTGLGPISVIWVSSA